MDIYIDKDIDINIDIYTKKYILSLWSLSILLLYTRVCVYVHARVLLYQCRPFLRRQILLPWVPFRCRTKWRRKRSSLLPYIRQICRHYIFSICSTFFSFPFCTRMTALHSGSHREGNGKNHPLLGKLFSVVSSSITFVCDCFSLFHNTRFFGHVKASLEKEVWKKI